MEIPTEADWGDYKADLDQPCAHDLFVGHTNEEMLPHFKRNVIERTDELRWMPEMPFRYYMIGFRDFLIAGVFDSACDAADAASCFLNLALQKLREQPTYILPIMRELLPALRYVAQNQASFDATPEIYGDFLETLSKIEALCSSQK